jgi:GLTT repeat (6 copies)
MSAVAALAVASPFAYVAVCNLSADTEPAPQHHDFVPAAGMTDLPGELISALSQGLSQFGVNLPPVPSLTGTTSPGLASPGLMSPGLTTPGLTSPGLTSPGLTTPGLTTPGLTSPGLTSPGVPSPGLTPGTTPGLTPGTTPGLTPGATPGLTDPSLTSPGLTSPGLTSPGGLTPGLTNPAGFDPSSGALPNPSEYPISDPIGLDPGAGGTYPILGDPSLGAAPAASSGGSGGLVSDLMSAANQLGARQAIDLLKGLVMPGITQAMQGANPAAAAAAPAAAVPALPVPAPPVPAPIP